MKSLKNDPKDLVLQVYRINGWSDHRRYRRSNFDSAVELCEKMYKNGSTARVVQRSENTLVDDQYPYRDVRVYPYQKDKYGKVVVPDFNSESITV